MVVALPRGGVVVGCEVAQALDAPLDILSVRKIGHPDNPEYAICATDELGTLLCDEFEAARLDRSWLEAAQKKEQAESLRRAVLYRGGAPPLSRADKTVIVVDDGVATGLTLRLALRRVQSESPKQIIAALPVLPAQLAGRLEEEGVIVEALEADENFKGAVGAYYECFDQVSDEEVIKLLSLCS